MANFHVLAGAGEGLAHPVVRKIGFDDLRLSLAEGWRDFWQKPSHIVFLGHAPRTRWGSLDWSLMRQRARQLLDSLDSHELDVDANGCLDAEPIERAR